VMDIIFDSLFGYLWVLVNLTQVEIGWEARSCLTKELSHDFLRLIIREALYFHENFPFLFLVTDSPTYLLRSIVTSVIDVVKSLYGETWLLPLVFVDLLPKSLHDLMKSNRPRMEFRINSL